MTDTFYADISEYQQVATTAYPYPILAFRADSGHAVDPNASANWAFCKDTARIQVAMAYVVFIPGQSSAILNRLKSLLGASPAKLVVMVDMESGSGFAGPGDHSVEADALVAGLDAWLGSPNRVLGYANSPDWAALWANHPAWLKRVVAKYSTTDPGAYAWQYYGGVAANPSPAGYPRSCPPFGGNVDMNVIHRSIDQIVTDFGLGAPVPFDASETAYLQGMEKRINAAIASVKSDLDAVSPAGRQHEYNMDMLSEQISADDKNTIVAMQATLTAMQAALSKLAAQ